MSCNAKDSVLAAKDFDRLSDRELAVVTAYLLASSAGLSTNAATVLGLASDFERLSDRDLQVCQTYALCVASGG